MKYAATIGFFDGVHKGHQYLIHQLKAIAKERGYQSAIITFEQHPKHFLTGQAPLLLNTYEERIERIKAQEVDEIFCFRFDIIQEMTAREFLHILKNQCNVDILLMGYDHHFGSDHLATIASYQAVGKEEGVDIIPIHQAPEGDISSSKIRQAIRRGDMTTANEMLGYPYPISGTVVHGKGLGRRLGFPTANIAVDSSKVIPLSGVYSGVVSWADKEYTCLINIGTNPTVGNDETSIEVHIPSFSGDVYGQVLTLQVIKFLRAEKKFATLDKLTQQIRDDIQSL